MNLKQLRIENAYTQCNQFGRSTVLIQQMHS